MEGVAVFPYHGSAADHLRERSIELLPANAILAGIDEETALLRSPEPPGQWKARRGHPLLRLDLTEGPPQIKAGSLTLP